MSFAPKKSLGQHWLRDAYFLEQMCKFAEVEEGDSVLEIGPGLGTLTKKLLLRTELLTAVEFDEDLANNLAKIMPDVKVINEDILDFDYKQMKPGFKVVANIPYYLTSHLVRKLLESPNQPSLIVLLIQKEVAERLAARPGKMSTLGVMAQFYADVTLGDLVPAKFFEPAPKVDSQIVVIRPHEHASEVDTKRFFRVVRAGFGERRKKLSNSLAGGLQLPKDVIQAKLSDAGFGENTRAQELSIEQWNVIYELFDDKMEAHNES